MSNSFSNQTLAQIDPLAATATPTSRASYTLSEEAR